MSYVKKTLSEKEKIVYEAHFHWTYTLMAFLALIVLGWIVIGVLIFLSMIIKKWTTEIAVTSSRLVFKTGWIKVQTEEVRIEKIEEVNVEQSFWGRILGYGTVKVSGTGKGYINLPTIENPLKFRTAIGNVRDGTY